MCLLHHFMCVWCSCWVCVDRRIKSASNCPARAAQKTSQKQMTKYPASKVNGLHVFLSNSDFDPAKNTCGLITKRSTVFNTVIELLKCLEIQPCRIQDSTNITHLSVKSKTKAVLCMLHHIVASKTLHQTKVKVTWKGRQFLQRLT